MTSPWQVEQPIPPAVEPAAQPAAQPRERLFALRFGFSGNEVPKPFDFGEVELAVLEGTPRELASLCQPATDLPREMTKQATNHGR